MQRDYKTIALGFALSSNAIALIGLNLYNVPLLFLAYVLAWLAWYTRTKQP